MKYMKTFESFSINENASDISGLLSVVNGEFSKLPEAERQRLLDETKAVADKLGVSLEQLADTDFAVKAMVDEAEKAEIVIEEGFFGDILSWIKSKASTFYRSFGKIIGFGGGLASFATMITAIGLGDAEQNAFNEYLRELTGIGELDRTTQAGLFLAGFAGLFISVFAGMALVHKGDTIDKQKGYGTKF